MSNDNTEILTVAFSSLNKLLQSFDSMTEDITNCDQSVLKNALDGVLKVADTLNLTEDIHNFSFDNEDVSELLKAAESAYLNKDFQFVLDLIEDKIIPVLSEWYDILEETLEE